MSLSVVVDMNLSQEWVPLLQSAGWTAVHWSGVGPIDAEDSAIMAWAVANKHAVFTHDLDFGTTLALTRAAGPSVLQIRTQRVLPEHVGALVLAALKQYEAELSSGAIVVVEAAKTRVRVLPL
jgi:predicted nuclease of predicted toxin-antitoxin system